MSYLKQLASRPVSKRYTRDRDVTGELAPMNLLIMVSDCISPNKKAFLRVARELPRVLLKIWVGEYVGLHHADLEGLADAKGRIKIEIPELTRPIYGKKRTTDGLTWWSFPKDTDTHITSYFHDLVISGRWELQNIQYVATIAMPAVCGRGVTAGEASFLRRKSEDQAIWGLTAVYTTFAKSTDLPEIQQRVARACRVDNTRRRCTLLTQGRVLTEITRTYYWTRELMRFHQAGNIPDGEDVWDAFLDQVHQKSKLPVGRSVLKHENFKARTHFRGTSDVREATVNEFRADAKGFVMEAAVKDGKKIQSAVLADGRLERGERAPPPSVELRGGMRTRSMTEEELEKEGDQEVDESTQEEYRHTQQAREALSERGFRRLLLRAGAELSRHRHAVHEALYRVGPRESKSLQGTRPG